MYICIYNGFPGGDECKWCISYVTLCMKLLYNLWPYFGRMFSVILVKRIELEYVHIIYRSSITFIYDVYNHTSLHTQNMLLKENTCSYCSFNIVCKQNHVTFPNMASRVDIQLYDSGVIQSLVTAEFKAFEYLFFSRRLVRHWPRLTCSERVYAMISDMVCNNRIIWEKTHPCL